MAKNKKIYICESCGNEFPKWQGQCPGCGDWNRIKEFKIDKAKHQGGESSKMPTKISSISASSKNRLTTNIREFDLVLGGGLVPGSITLLSGQPGIGKSTILIQVASQIKGKVLYLSGEESEDQIKARYDRLGLKEIGDIELLASQDINNLERLISKEVKLIIVDSIQTVYDSNTDRSAGGVAQIKACGYQLQRIAKEKEVSVIVTGHITKQGRIAGPMTLEHLVDTVLYLEGDNRYDQRILKSVKNRFGSTGEVGIFKMTKKGLKEITNPSSIFLSESISAGTVKSSIIEGQRPLVVEIQALAEKSVFGYPKRRAQGISANRLEMLAAVVSNKTKVNLSGKDVYVSIVGGLSVDEPSIDLAVCLSVISSAKNRPIDSDLVCFGEIGLSGETRPVAFTEPRLKEIRKQGFNKVLISEVKGKVYKSKSVEIITVGTLKEAVENVF
jgi:DNA repair protein RadA/Sms